MRMAAGVISVPVVLVLLAFYVVTLGWAGYSLAPGDDRMLQMLYAGMGGGIVLLEAVGVIQVRHLFKSRQYVLSFFGVLLLIAAAIYTVRLELAYHVTGQSDRIAERQADTDRRQSAERREQRLLAEAETIGVQQPPAAIRAELDSYREHKRWISTSGCTDATIPQSIQYCAQYHKMQAELASSVRLTEINEQLAAIRSEKQWIPVNAGGSPEAAWASRVFGGDEMSWRDMLLALGIFVGLLIRNFSLAMAFGSLEGARREIASPPSPQTSETVDVTPDETVVLLSDKLKEQRKDEPEPKGPVETVLSTVSGSEISYPDLSNKVNRECLKRGIDRMSSRSLGETMRDLGYDKFKVRDTETGADVTWYDLGSGGAPRSLSEAA